MHCAAWDTYRSDILKTYATQNNPNFFVRLRYANRTYYNHFFASDASIIYNTCILQFAYPQ
jgi:hypothetical protein